MFLARKRIALSREEGYEEGYKKGWQKGFKKGWQKGYDDGWQQGFKEGYAESKAARDAEYAPKIRALQELIRELRSLNGKAGA